VTMICFFFDDHRKLSIDSPYGYESSGRVVPNPFLIPVRTANYLMSAARRGGANDDSR
jgi:hypothetical protein